MIRSFLVAVIKNPRGISAAEYAVLAAGVVALVAVAATTYGGRLSARLTGIFPT